MFFPDRIKGISPNDKVLEIGPGSCPHPRSDIFLEKKFKETEAFEQRGKSIVNNNLQSKPTIYYDGDIFPFKDKEFDYVICSHVLEHVNDIDFFIKETIRVGKKGYFEFPTIYYDYLYNFDVHLTFLLYKDNCIRWLPKADTAISEFQHVNKFFYKSLEKNYTCLIDGLKEFIFQGFEWERTITSTRVQLISDVCYNINDLNFSQPLHRSITPNDTKISNSFYRKKLKLQSKIINILKKSTSFLDNISSKVSSFHKEFKQFHDLSKTTKKRFNLKWEDRYPCLQNRTSISGFDTHYIYHIAWAARILSNIQPKLHIDFSSSLYFSTMISAFIPTEFYDFHKAEVKLSDLKVGITDLISLSFPNDSIESLSCMHVIEHVGLGRYGDKFDYDGDIKAIKEIKRVLKPGGNLLFVVPVGKPKIMFNAHRIYSYEQIMEQFKGLKLIEFSLIPDNGIEIGIQINATKDMSDIQDYGCGLFWFKK